MVFLVTFVIVAFASNDAALGARTGLQMSVLLAIGVVAACRLFGIRNGRYALALGLPLGGVFFVLVGQVVTFLDLPPETLWFMAPVALGFLAVQGPRHLDSTKWVTSDLWLLLPILIGAFSIQTFARLNEIGSSPRAIDGDLPVHNSLAVSLVEVGPSQWLAGLDLTVRYHWLSDAIAGELQRFTSSDPYLQLTVLLPAFSIVATVLVAAAIGEHLGFSPVARAISCLFLVGGSSLGSGILPLHETSVTPYSPSLLIGISAFLCLWLSVMIFAESPLGVGKVALIGFTSFAVVMSRINLLIFVPLIVLGVLFYCRSRKISKYAFALGAALAGSALALVLLFAPKSTGATAGAWLVEPNFDLLQFLGLVPIFTLPGLALAVLSLLCLISVSLLGLVNVWALGEKRLVVVPLGILFIGVLGTLLTRQVGYSHFSFIIFAMVPILLIAGLGAGVALEDLRKLSGWRSVTVIVGTTFLIVIGTITQNQLKESLATLAFQGPIRWGIPLLNLVLALFLGTLIFVWLRRSHERITLASSLGVVSIVVLVATWGFREGSLRTLPLTESAGTVQNGTSVRDLEAGSWVASHTPEDAVFATNRQCANDKEVPPECASNRFDVSGFGRRQALVEGASNSISTDFSREGTALLSFEDRIAKSSSFGLSPSRMAAEELKRMGVDFYWLDKSLPFSPDIYVNAKLIFENDSVSIFEL